MEKTLKINAPKGYEIDKEKSTFDNIVFKKSPLQEMVSIKWNNWYNGVEIHADGEHFVVSGRPSYAMNWNDAKRYFIGDTWKLPTINQLKIIYKYLNTVNQIIKGHNCFEICYFYYFWSSEEKDETSARNVFMRNGCATDTNKDNFLYARSVVNL